jgi:UDP-glucose 4-epimerase
MRILVFGGSGFVGLNIAAALLDRGHTVTLFDRAGLPPAAQSAFAHCADRLTTVQGDVTDGPLVETTIAGGSASPAPARARHRA